MRVNLFAPTLPMASGIASYSADYAAALAARGAHVRPVNPSFWRTWRFEVPTRTLSLTRRILDHARVVGLAELYPRPDADGDTINHFHVSGNPFTYILLRHFMRMRGKRVITVHDRHFVTDNARAPRQELDELRLLRACDLVIVHTAEMKDALDFINPRVEVVGHGVEPARFAVDPAQAKRRIGVAGPIVAHLGFLFDYKGVELLLKAAARLDATVLIVGSGPFEGEARRLAAVLCPGKAVFRPYVSDEEFPVYLAASDVVALPRRGTQGECSGVMVQAMAAGCAIVAHDMGCFREYLAGGRGVLTRPDDIGALRDGIAGLLASPAARVRHGEAARAFVHAQLTWGAMAGRHHDLFAELIAPRAESTRRDSPLPAPRRWALRAE